VVPQGRLSEVLSNITWNSECDTYLVYYLCGVVVLLAKQRRPNEGEYGHEIVQDQLRHPGCKVSNQQQRAILHLWAGRMADAVNE
jgi:hypothetical protein